MNPPKLHKMYTLHVTKDIYPGEKLERVVHFGRVMDFGIDVLKAEIRSRNEACMADSRERAGLGPSL